MAEVVASGSSRAHSVTSWPVASSSCAVDRPETPAPSTRTRAGRTVPAAVVSIGKNLGRCIAAKRTARYPATVACEDRASIRCARVVLGILSMAIAEMFRASGVNILGRSSAPEYSMAATTESAMFGDLERAKAALQSLKNQGVRIALDDFGTGYSALNYLARFPVDCLKIDKSFVQAIGRSERDSELVKAFIAMAGALKLGLVAEGVETDEQAAFLLAHGCGTGQGYRFGRPMAEDRFEQLLRPSVPT